jgi:hypothetical protein
MGAGRISLLRTWYMFLIRAERELRKVESPEARELLAEIEAAKEDVAALMQPNSDEVM